MNEYSKTIGRVERVASPFFRSKSWYTQLISVTQELYFVHPGSSVMLRKATLRFVHSNYPPIISQTDKSRRTALSRLVVKLTETRSPRVLTVSGPMTKAQVLPSHVHLEIFMVTRLVSVPSPRSKFGKLSPMTCSSWLALMVSGTLSLVLNQLASFLSKTFWILKSTSIGTLKIHRRWPEFLPMRLERDGIYLTKSTEPRRSCPSKVWTKSERKQVYRSSKTTSWETILPWSLATSRIFNDRLPVFLTIVY